MAILVDVALNRISGIPTDASHNTFIFQNEASVPTEGEMDFCEAAVKGFYNNVHSPSTIPVAGFFAQCVSRVSNAHTMTFYGFEPGINDALGAPNKIINWTLQPINGNPVPYPPEVAVVLSLHANNSGFPEHAPGGARPKSRRRGRLYIGPLANSVAGTIGATQEQEVGQPYRDVLGGAAAALVAASMGASLPWSIWSRVNGSLSFVVGGFVDNAFDTLRSRGTDATARTTWGDPASFFGLPSPT